MKTVFILLSVWILQASIYASDTTLVFRDIPYAQVFEKAQQENKLVLLYFHFEGCGACIQMEKEAFLDREVAAYYNQHFISISINTLKGEGIEISKMYKTSLYPTFLYLSEYGNLLHKAVGAYSPEEFISQARYATEGINTYTNAIKQYTNGDRDPDFLYRYCYLLRDAHELPVTAIDEYINTQSGADFYLEKNIRFIYEFALHQFEVGIAFNSPAYNFMLEHKEQFTPYFEAEQIDTRLIWIADQAAETGIQHQDEELFNQALAVIDQLHEGKVYYFKEMDGRTTGLISEKNLPLKLRLEYERKKGNTYQYRSLSKEYLDGVWDDPETLNEMAWQAYLLEDNQKELKKAIKWSIRSIKLENSYAANDTYAALLFKTGKNKKAYDQAQKALAIARAENMDYQETMDLIKRIEEHQE